MNRYMILGLLLVAGVWTLVWLVRDLGSNVLAYDQEIRDGGRGLTKPARGIPTEKLPPLPRSRLARDEVLSFHLAERDPDAGRGGSQLLSLRGNDVIFVRPSADTLRWTRSILGRENGDHLLRELLASPGSEESSGIRVEIEVEGKKTRRTIDPKTAQEILGREHPRSRTWVPKSLQLEVGLADRNEESLPWPVTRPKAEEFLNTLSPFRAPKGTMGTLIEKWSPGVVLEAKDGRKFRILRIWVDLP